MKTAYIKAQAQHHDWKQLANN